MEYKTILLADKNTAFRQLLTDTLNQEPGVLVTAGTDRLEETLRLCQLHKPTLLILELALFAAKQPNFLEQVQTLPQPPAILLLTEGSEKQYHGVTCLSRYAKPGAFLACVRRMITPKREADTPPTPAVPKPIAPERMETEDLETCITLVIHEIGIPANIRGYQYLRDAIRLTTENEEAVYSITKQLYPAVAEHYRTTSARVERAMRHAIQIAWDRGNLDILKKYFGYTVSSMRGKPTNSEFIAMISDHLRLQQKHWAR